VKNSKITFCNRAYAKKWFRNLKRQNPSHFDILEAIIEEIEENEGGDISKESFFRRRPDIVRLVNSLEFDIIPSRGQMLRHNGNGIRHAKYSPSKSIAVIWERIGDTIFITFDDHAPIRYHRAICHLRDLRLGKPALPRRARITGRFLRRIKDFWTNRHLRRFKGFNPRDRYYE